MAVQEVQVVLAVSAVSAVLEVQVLETALLGNQRLHCKSWSSRYCTSLHGHHLKRRRIA